MTTPMRAEADAGRRPVDESEIWLRGNVRPAVGLLAAAGAVAAIVVVAIAFGQPARWLSAVAAVGAAAFVAMAAALAWSASRPRLVRRGPVLEVRLSPLVVHHIPVDVVECVFPGSQSLDGDGEPESAVGRRVNTLVLRLAERAVDWKTRPVVAAWGAWNDGNVVFDGRWCEPLSASVTREISARLLEARRQAVGVGETRP